MSKHVSAHAALVDAVLSHIRPSLRATKRPLAELLAEEFELRARTSLRRLDNVIAEQERLGDQNVTLRRRAAALEAFIERYVDSATPDQIVAQWESDHPLPAGLQEIKEVAVDIDIADAIVVTDEALTLAQQTTIAGLEARLRERAENEARLAEQCGTLSAAMLGFLREELRPAPGEILPPHEWTARLTEEIQRRDKLDEEIEAELKSAQDQISTDRALLEACNRDRAAACEREAKLSENLALVNADKRDVEQRAARAESLKTSAEAFAGDLQEAIVEQALLLRNLTRIARATRREHSAQFAADFPF